MLTIKKILYPIDLDTPGENIVRQAVSIARQFGAQLHFLYVNHPQAGYRTPYNNEDEVALAVRGNISWDELSDVVVHYATSKGELEDEVNNYCEAQKIDLILISHKHHSKLYLKLFDTAQECIVNRADIPVMVLPLSKDTAP